MADEFDMSNVPQLSLDPGTQQGAFSPAASDAVAAVAAQTAEPTPAPTMQENIDAAKKALDEEKARLSPAERKAVEDFAQKIDIGDTGVVLQYGAAAQKKVADFSDAALANVRTKDLGEVGDKLANLVVELKGMNFSEEEKKGLFGFRKKIANKLEVLKADYAKAEVNVDKITEALQGHQVTLLKDVSMLDKMYDKNQDYFKELTMYILAGKERLEQCQGTLAQLKAKAAETGRPEDAQAANDYANLINRFDKKLYDLELTRMISVQMAPQIRMLQNNDSLLIEKIQTSIVNTIPLWKSQMVMALGLAHSQQALNAEREVTNLTNELLKKNSEMLKTGSIAIAKESERGIVDMETLRITNQNLITTLEEVQRIQNEGTAKRREAEAELGRIETELKNKLLELRTK